MSGHARLDSPSVRSLGVSSMRCHISRTGRTPPASGQRPMPASSLLLLTGRVSPSETSVRSLTVTSVFSVLSTGGTVGLSALYGRTLRRWSFLPLHLNFTTFDKMCQPPSVSPCAHVLAYFHNIFKGVSTPLDHKCICNELEHLVAL